MHFDVVAAFDNCVSVLLYAFTATVLLGCILGLVYLIQGIRSL